MLTEAPPGHFHATREKCATTLRFPAATIDAARAELSTLRWMEAAVKGRGARALALVVPGVQAEAVVRGEGAAVDLTTRRLAMSASSEWRADVRLTWSRCRAGVESIRHHHASEQRQRLVDRRAPLMLRVVAHEPMRGVALLVAGARIL
jgi:hypothetical protein